MFSRLGPYHVARIATAAAMYPTVAIEFSRDIAHYGWDRVESQGFARHTVVSDGLVDDVPRVRFARRLFRILDETRPSVLALPGWYHYGALLALHWSLRTQTPAVMMSDSQATDEPRRWWKERIKRRVLSLCSAALVAGQRQADYVRELGMPSERIFYGYDVVDNDYFTQQTDRVRMDALAHRRRLQLPERFFVASSRFIPKKNLPLLLRAYARYRRASRAEAFKLVVLGDGPMRSELEGLRRALDLEADVLFAGFQQYAEIPSYYGLAAAFVHASTVEQWGLVVNEAMAAGLPVIVSRNCGCVPELVHDGDNGFTFDPLDEVDLSQRLAQVASDGALRSAMGQRSRELVGRLSLQFFAEQLARASKVASCHRKGANLAELALVTALAMR